MDFYCLVAVVALLTDWRTEPRRVAALVAVLGVAAVGQTWGAVRFRPLASSAPTAIFTLPFTATNRVDYFVTPGDVEWAQELLAEARAGKTLLLVYNHSSYQEDPTNPSGVLERLYLNLGHERFTTQITVFGDERRWIEMPIRPMGDLEAFVDQLRDVRDLAGYLAIGPRDFGVSARARQGTDERARVLRALERRFAIVWGDLTRHAEPLWIRTFSLRETRGSDPDASRPVVDHQRDMG